MKKAIVGFFVVAALAAVLLSSPEYFIAAVFLDKIEKSYGIFAKRRAIALLEMMNDARDDTERLKLDKVNDFFNDVPYASDQSVWGVGDYWATRLEFIGKDRGDCEDYVIAKYFTLVDLGIPSKKLALVYAKSLRFKTAHMVLAYYETPRSVPLILDNLNLKILPATQRDDLVPVYSFSGDDLINAKQAALGRMLPAASRQTRPWDEFIIQRKDN